MRPVTNCLTDLFFRCTGCSGGYFIRPEALHVRAQAEDQWVTVIRATSGVGLPKTWVIPWFLTPFPARPRTPGSTRAARQNATLIVACRRDKPVGTLQRNFRGSTPCKVGSTRYLCTSPALAPTHRRGCYQPRRKARYWARGSRLPRRDSHPLEHAALPGRTVPGIPRASRRQRKTPQRECPLTP